MHTVSVIVPSLNRPASLRRALASLCAQKTAMDITMEIIAVDNSTDGNARRLVAELGAMIPPKHTLTYVSESRPGISSARNAGISRATGQWIAFLDDDEEAQPDWISQLIRVARETGADAVFGPIEAKSDGAIGIGAMAPYFSRRIEAVDCGDITDLAAHLGTNNSMFRRQTCFATPRPFDETLDSIGGEDSLLLQQLVLRKCRFAWSARAGVTEWAAQKRLNWAYVRKRKFLSGQIRVFVNHMSRPGRWDRIALWMSVGALQFTTAGIAALLLWPVDRVSSARASAIAWGGLGKVLWAPRFRPALYGPRLVS